MLVQSPSAGKLFIQVPGGAMPTSSPTMEKEESSGQLTIILVVTGVMIVLTAACWWWHVYQGDNKQTSETQANEYDTQSKLPAPATLAALECEPSTKGKTQGQQKRPSGLYSSYPNRQQSSWQAQAQHAPQR